MAQNFLSDLKMTLDNCIAELDEIHFMFCKNPEADFTRNRKLSFHDYIQFMLQMQSKSVSNEILDFFEHSLSASTKSAFTQQRFKLQPEGWDFLFHIFVTQCRELSDQLFHGYRLLACDGSNVNIARDPDDERTFIHEGEKGYNAIHVNALYDIMNHTYCDFLVQGKKKLHERAALNTITDRYPDSVPAILMADRGYETYNIFANVQERGLFYLIRIKDTSKRESISGSLSLPVSCEFDEEIELIMTRKQKFYKTKGYKYLSNSSPFDFLDFENLFYTLHLRLTQFQLENGVYECIASNLDKEEFPPKKIKELYHMRWGIETSFRELKYTIGLTNLHSKNVEYICQEIYAKLIQYNFCEIISANIILE